MTQKIAVFLTTEVAQARLMLGRLLDRHPDAIVVVYVGVDARWLLSRDLEYCVVRPDKPVGGKANFVRGLRAEKFDLLYVAWHGGARPQPLRLVALLAGAARTIAIDEFDKQFEVGLLRPNTWLLHAARRATSIRLVGVARIISTVYRCTIGGAVAVVSLAAFALLRRPGAAAKDRRR
jgi:hypothetical protein